ncbi:F-box protein At3g07870 [Linum grandiflorum]
MLIDILTRLPPKSLLRYLSVSKSFHSLITTPTFISAHTNHSRRKLLLRHYSWSHTKELFTIHDPDYSFFSRRQEEELDFGFRSYAKYFEIVGSVNGLLCLCDTHRVNSHTVFLWNPTIRKSVVLPPPSVDFKRVSNFVHGFGFDLVTRDYKVVKVTYPHFTVSSPEIEIYELSKNSWRRRTTKRDDQTTPYNRDRVISELSGQAFLKGAIHWVGYSNRAEFRGLGIVAFDLGREGFRELKLPECLSELSTLEVWLMPAEESEELSLVEYYGGGGGGRRNQWVQYGGCGVWVMEEYGVESSWVKRFNVEAVDGGVGKALRLRKKKDGESAAAPPLLMVSSGGEVVCLSNGDEKNGGIVGLGMKGIPQSFHLVDFVETLVLIGLELGTDDQSLGMTNQ